MGASRYGVNVYCVWAFGVLFSKISELVGALVGLVIVKMLFSLFKAFSNGCL